MKQIHKGGTLFFQNTLLSLLPIVLHSQILTKHPWHHCVRGTSMNKNDEFTTTELQSNWEEESEGILSIGVRHHTCEEYLVPLRK